MREWVWLGISLSSLLVSLAGLWVMRRAAKRLAAHEDWARTLHEAEREQYERLQRSLSEQFVRAFTEDRDGDGGKR